MKTKLIYGAVALIGLFVLITVVRLGDSDARKSSGAQPTAAAASPTAKWTVMSGSRKGQTVDWSTATESERRMRQTELESSAAAQVRRMQGGNAGGEAPRYKTDPQGIGYAIIEVKPALRACYEELGKFDPKLLPKDVHVRVTIASDPTDPTRGIVQAVTAESDFQHPTVETCLQKAVSSLRFDPPAKPILANLPMEFAQRN